MPRATWEGARCWYLTPVSRASALATFRPNWSNTSSTRYARRQASRCTFPCAGPMPTTWSKPASRRSPAHCARPCAATANPCPAPRACSHDSLRSRFPVPRPRLCVSISRTMHVAVVDSGGTNIASVLHALQRLGASAELTADAERIRSAERVLLPGVGAAAPAMRALRARGLDRVLASLTQPVLGICLGMQLLYAHSEEGDSACLGLL